MKTTAAGDEVRGKIIEEIIASERDYVKLLHAIIKVSVKPWLHVQFLHVLLLNCLQFLQRAAILACKNYTCNHSLRKADSVVVCSCYMTLHISIVLEHQLWTSYEPLDVNDVSVAMIY